MIDLIGPMLGAIGTLNIFVLGYLASQIRNLGNKMEYLVKDPTCKERKEQCAGELNAQLQALRQEDKELWQAFNCHSHIGLGCESKVVR